MVNNVSTYVLGPILLNVTAPPNVENALRVFFEVPEYFNAEELPNEKIDPDVHAVKVNCYCQTETEKAQTGNDFVLFINIIFSGDLNQNCLSLNGLRHVSK